MKTSTKYLLAFLPSVLVIIGVAVLNPPWFANDGWWERSIPLMLGLGLFSGMMLYILDRFSDA